MFPNLHNLSWNLIKLYKMWSFLFVLWAVLLMTSKCFLYQLLTVCRIILEVSGGGLLTWMTTCPQINAIKRVLTFLLPLRMMMNLSRGSSGAAAPLVIIGTTSMGCGFSARKGQGLTQHTGGNFTTRINSQAFFDCGAPGPVFNSSCFFFCNRP